MFVVSRTKRVTYWLDHKARARIVGGGTHDSDYVSSGSEHSAEAEGHHHDVTDIFFNFPANEEENNSCRSPSDDDVEPSLLTDHHCHSNNVAYVVKPIVEDNSDEFRNALRDDVWRALRMFVCHDDDDDEDDDSNKKKILLRRNVMGYLRDRGYDAAVCKTKWKGGGGVTAGNYEFVDVEGPRRRYLVDVDFRSEFEIARPTSSYELGLESLPRVFVGGSEEIKAIIGAMSEAARRSMKTSGLLTPPWRKRRFMQNKWLGAYRRTVNTTTTSSRGDVNGVMCRAVGFDGSSVLPAAARTR